MLNYFHFDLVFLGAPLRLCLSSDVKLALCSDVCPGLTFLPQTPKQLGGQRCAADCLTVLLASFLVVHKNHIECGFS